MKTKTLIIIGIAFILLLGISLIIVQAQYAGRINSRCNAGGIIEADYIYKIRNNSYTNYQVSMVAGRCKIDLKGRVNTTTNLGTVIRQDIINRMIAHNLTWNPDGSLQQDLTGRGSFSL